MYAGYPVIGTAQGALHFNPWPTCSFQRHFDFVGKHQASLHLLREDYPLIYPLPSVARYSCIELSELWQCGVNEIGELRNGSKRIRSRVLSIESPTF